MNFIDQVEHFVRMGGGVGPADSDRKIDVAARFVDKAVFEWMEQVWAPLRKIPSIPPQNSSYGDETTWTHFRASFIARFVTSASRQKTRLEFDNLRLASDVTSFNRKCRELIRMITDGQPLTNIYRNHYLFSQYVNKLSARYQEIIITNHLQRADLINSGHENVR